MEQISTHRCCANGEQNPLFVKWKLARKSDLLVRNGFCRVGKATTEVGG